MHNVVCVTTHHNLQDEGDRLDRLSQAHLVCENAVLSGVPVEEEPVQPLHLVGPELVPAGILRHILDGLEV